MTPKESIDFFAGQVSVFEEGYAFAQSSGNYHLLSLNSRQIFQNQIMQGLVMWRLTESPRLFFEKAIERGLESVAAIAALNPSATIESAFDIEKLKIFAFLVDKAMPVEGTWRSIDAPDRKLDFMLGLSLYNEPSLTLKDEVDPELAKLSKNKKSSLAAQSYQLYFDILNESEEAPAVRKKVEHAEKLYSERKANGFYSGGCGTEGGGADNSLVVDYRLGAVLKRINYGGSCIHRWQW